MAHFAHLFQNESYKDITFVFKDSDEKVTAHKLFLGAASPAFKTMFSGKFARTDKVEINDISPEVLKIFLSGLYMNDIPSQVNSDEPAQVYADLYYAAEKYDVKDIREIAKKGMISTCNEGNAYLLLTKATEFNLPDLEVECKFILALSYVQL